MFATKHILRSNIAVKNGFLPNIVVKKHTSEKDVYTQTMLMTRYQKIGAYMFFREWETKKVE